MGSVMQVENSNYLLDLMVKDSIDAPGEYRATARWDGYSKKMLSFLKEEGLKDFRRRVFEKDSPGATLASFGAVDVNYPDVSGLKLFHSAASCICRVPCD